MELEKFIENFADQFEETDITHFKANTVFKDLDEWSSLIALSIIAMADNDYNVKLKGDDIKNTNTIEDLYIVVRSRI